MLDRFVLMFMGNASSPAVRLPFERTALRVADGCGEGSDDWIVLVSGGHAEER